MALHLHLFSPTQRLIWKRPPKSSSNQLQPESLPPIIKPYTKTKTHINKYVSEFSRENIQIYSIYLVLRLLLD